MMALNEPEDRYSKRRCGHLHLTLWGRFSLLCSARCRWCGSRLSDAHSDQIISQLLAAIETHQVAVLLATGVSANWRERSSHPPVAAAEQRVRETLQNSRHTTPFTCWKDKCPRKEPRLWFQPKRMMLPNFVVATYRSFYRPGGRDRNRPIIWHRPAGRRTDLGGGHEFPKGRSARQNDHSGRESWRIRPERCRDPHLPCREKLRSMQPKVTTIRIRGRGLWPLLAQP